MIRGLSHATILVEDHDEAKAFYTEKLGFEVRSDVTLDGFRWLTVGAPDQAHLELALMAIQPGGPIQEEDVDALRRLLRKGAFGAGVLHTEDCQATYEELKGRGVEFIQEPTERPYGIEATFKDNSGNWYSLTQPTEMEGM